ncbi:MAG: septum site-determining protein MinC [Pseudomonadota bacterium]
MSVALAGQAPTSFEIKSAQLPLVALRLKSTDLALLARELEARFGDMPDFFEDDALLIDFSWLDADAPVPDMAALLALLRARRLTPLAFRGGSPAMAQAAREAALVPAEDAALPREREAVAPAPAPAPQAAPAPASPADTVVPAAPSGALVVERPLRSGQQVYARGRDLVVLAMVNPGAEVIADGHIHVYAPLRGKAIAGARGNAEARIFALSLEPELLSIAGVYRTAEQPLPAEVWRKPAQVRLLSDEAGDKLVMQAMGA